MNYSYDFEILKCEVSLIHEIIYVRNNITYS